MNRTLEIQSPLSWKATRWGLVAALVLLLVVSAGTQGSIGAEGQRSEGAGEKSTIRIPQSAITISYAYDAAGRLVSANYGGGVGLVYNYDATGNLVGVSPGGGRGLHLPLIMR